MGIIFWIVTALAFYAACRAIKGGFERPQSERLNGYGILGIAIVLLVLASWLNERLPPVGGCGLAPQAIQDADKPFRHWR
jgi:hypothetical protein